MGIWTSTRTAWTLLSTSEEWKGSSAFWKIRQRLTNQGVVVRNTNTDHDSSSMTRVGGCERGMEADVSQVPLSINVSSEPPTVESLSFIPRIPIPEEGNL